MSLFTLLRQRVAVHFHFGPSNIFPREIYFWENATVPLWFFGYLCLATTEQQILESN